MDKSQAKAVAPRVNKDFGKRIEVRRALRSLLR